MAWTRIAFPLDWVELERIVKANQNYRLVYRRANCQHGKTRTAFCRECESGYGTDAHTYANVGDIAMENGALLIAVSDDGNDVAYVPKRFENRPTLRTWDLIWSPDGHKLDTVQAFTAKAAKRMAPKPYRRMQGEIYAILVDGPHPRVSCTRGTR